MRSPKIDKATFHDRISKNNHIQSFFFWFRV